MGHDGLRELEHLVLLAMSRLDPPVHGVPIVDELRRTVKRSISRASVYVVLRRLEARGYVVSAMGDPTPERGGRAKRLYSLTPLAVQSLKAARRDFIRLWAGSRVLLVLLAVLPLAAGAAAQSSAMPDLSGTWISISDPNATDAATAANLPNALLTIVHRGERFDLQRSWTNAPIKASFVCDGRTENTNGYSVVVERTTCRWDPAERQLVIEGSIGRADGPPTGRMRSRYRLDAGGVLHVEGTREVFSLQAPPRVTTSRYRKIGARSQAPGH
jgi:DNA-binding PadR family transcriptional regulator